MKKILEKCVVDSEKSLEKANYSIKNKKKLVVITLNPEGLMTALGNDEIKELYLRDETLLVCESVGIKYAIKKVLKVNTEIYPGVEMFSDLLNDSIKLNAKVYLYGAKPEVVKKLKDHLLKKKINICGYNDGYATNSEDLEKRKKKIINCKPDIVACALGVNYQELLIKDLYEMSKRGLFIGVGGSFDVLSGQKKRAPSFFRKTRLEWLYRITKEPSRIKKFINNNVKLIFLVSKERKK